MKFKKVFAIVASLLISSVSLSAFTAVSAATGTCTWTGAGDGASFSDASNWSGCGGAPTNGDSLAFDDSILSSGANLNNDVSGLILNQISFSGTSSHGQGYRITGDGISITGGIVDASSDAANYVGFSSITLLNNQTFSRSSTDGGFTIGTYPSNPSSSLDTNNYALTLDSSAANTSIIIADSITGSGVINVEAATSIDSWEESVQLGEASSFTGQVNLLQGRLTGDISSLTAASGITISNGATLWPTDPYGQGGQTISTPITMSGNGWDDRGRDWGAVMTSLDEGDNSSKITFSGPITLVGDTAVSTDTSMTFTGSMSGGHTLSLIPGSGGKLVVASSANTSGTSNGTSTAPVDVTTIDAATDDSSQTLQIPSTITPAAQSAEYIVDGTAGATTLMGGGLLKGNGTVGALTVQTGAAVAPGHSPGCLNTGSLTEGGTYEVNIDGTAPCSDYDQLNVTGSVNLTGGVLTVALGSGYTPKAGTAYEIIRNDGQDAVTGALSYDGSRLAEGGTFTVDGTVFQISYKGGDGNDVVLTAKTVPKTPDTGFALAAAHPGTTLGVAAACGLLLLGGAYRYRKLIARR